jgi:hypothetical protein
MDVTTKLLMNTDLIDGCAVWTGYQENGYGRITIDGVRYAVHRLAYETYVGPIPDGLHIDHLCRNRACWMPSHLEPVTQAENNRRQGEAVTVCRRGHPLTKDNVYQAPPSPSRPQGGGRQCRICRSWTAKVRNAR